MDFSEIRDDDLFRLWAQAMTALKNRGMLTNGSPLGWATEELVCERLNLERSPVNTHHYDATGPEGERYQIKGRAGGNNVNGLRGLDGGHFDFLVAVLFWEDYRTVRLAVKMRHAAVSEVAKLTSANGHGFNLTQNIANREGVDDITDWLA